MVINSSQDRTNAVDIFLQIGNLQNKEPFAVICMRASVGGVILEWPLGTYSDSKTNDVILINVILLKLNIKILFGGPAVDILNFYRGETRA